MLSNNNRGTYTFVYGIASLYSSGISPLVFAIIHVNFVSVMALIEGYVRIERQLRDVKRPHEAICGMELRIPAVLSREAFDEFNRPYIDQLKTWGLEVAGANPVTRTNVAFETSVVSKPMLE